MDAGGGMTTNRQNELDLDHLINYRAVLRWCYDHGLLKGEFPISDSATKVEVLDWGERRLQQLINSEVLAVLKELEQTNLLPGVLDVVPLSAIQTLKEKYRT